MSPNFREISKGEGSCSQRTHEGYLESFKALGNLLEEGNCFTSSDPHHDMSKQPVDSTFVCSSCKLDKTMLVLLHQIAAAATFYFSARPLQSKPIRSHWQSTVSGCLQCIIDRPGLQPLQRRSSFGFQLVSQFSQVGRRAFA